MSRYLTPGRIETRVPTPDSLRPWLTELTATPTRHDITQPFAHPPVTSTTVVVRTESSGRRAAFVIGAQTKAAYSQAERPGGCVRLRLAPGTTGQLLGVSAAELTDRVVSLAELPGPLATITDSLTHLSTAEAIKHLGVRLPQAVSESATERAHRIVLREAISEVGAAPTVADLATRLAVSERQLRSLFAAGIGLSPRHFVRIDRVRRVLTAAGKAPWSDLAAATGYYDQSHLTADFRTLMGVPPAAYLRGELPPPMRCRSPA
ncbi:helix-turn-helix domain-containing protein [Nocardia ignorata]|uniref:AraC family transcriptional regulator n=1 Tax=Nocardia ignorata TaxID=145285 RepID=A0A4R6P567_NOCIG|nr:helix-turn-helix domain-containing protein [Nocardia ignorata]TDP32426.1 AraC family transcriptional regulator [Nocardia ignorata]